MGVISRVYFDYAKSKREIEPAYSSCPFECLLQTKQYDFKRNKKCDDCPHKLAEDVFKADYNELISAIFGKEARKFLFEKMRNALFTVMGFDENSKSLSVKNSIMLNKFNQEKFRYEKIEDLEKEKQAKNG